MDHQAQRGATWQEKHPLRFLAHVVTTLETLVCHADEPIQSSACRAAGASRFEG